MTKLLSPPPSTFRAIKYWPTWIGISILWLIAYLPFFLRINFGTGLGLLTYFFARERRYIAEVNIALCFPEFNKNEQRQLCRECFVENGIGLIETVTSWARSPEYFRNNVTIEGIEAAKSVLSQGKGVIIVGAHFSTLDLGGILLSLFLPFSPTFRPHNNLLFNAIMLKGRGKYCQPIDRNNIRGIFKCLKKGQAIWYAPDQDYHRSEHAVQAPFFGKMASTINTTSRLASINNSAVFILRHHRINRSNHYHLALSPALGNFPSGNIFEDTSLINEKLEQAIRYFPAQYLWMHKRFKTQPEGKPASPYINVKTSCKTITVTQFNTVSEGILELKKYSLDGKVYQLKNGLFLRIFPGALKKYKINPHLAQKFDYHAKQLRTKNIATITVDNIFNVPALGFTAVTYFAPAGNSLMLAKNNRSNFPLLELASFISQVHQAGFLFTAVAMQKLVYNLSNFSILSPEQIKVLPCSASYADRCDNVRLFIQKLELSSQEAKLFCHEYLIKSHLINNVDFMRYFSKIYYPINQIKQ